MMNHRAPTFYSISINKEIFLMSVSSTKNDISTDKSKQVVRSANWQTMLFWGVILSLVVVAVGMRLYKLVFPFDRDGYNACVYWKNLTSLSASPPLTPPIYYPPSPYFI